MGERPILFRDDMVRAILDGRKTVTRRVGKTWATAKPGDRLWVREAWNVGAWVSGDGFRVWFEEEATIPKTMPDVELVYRADDSIPAMATYPPRWRPSIHMPRWACRLELEVVSVTPEPWGVARNGMTEAEAHREGFAEAEDFIFLWCEMHPEHFDTVYRVEFRRVTP